MKAIIFDVKRFAVHDGPGIRTTLFLKGCPLRCAWCHNPESQLVKPLSLEVERKLNGRTVRGTHTYGEEVEIDAVLEKLLRDRTFYEESGGGVTFSGGEPLMQAEVLSVLLEACRKEGIHTAVDTCGHAPWDKMERIAGLADLFLYDLKNMDSELHRKHTGVDNRLILKNIDRLLGGVAEVIIRIPVIPGVNTREEELSAMIGFLEERSEKISGVHLLPYHRIAENKYRRLNMPLPSEEIKEPKREFIEEMKRKFEVTGIEISIGG